jgi:predicted small lipoprotein YifL
VRRLALPFAALLAALALAACGSSGGGLIPHATASELNTDLTNIQVAVDEGDCSATTTQIATAQTHFDNISTKVNRKLRAQLLAGFAALKSSAASACANNSTSSSTSSTTTTSTTTSSASTTSTTTTSSAATTSTSSAATTSSSSSAATTTTTPTTGQTCIPITNPNGGLVCEGSSATNGVGAGTGGAGD